MSNYLEQRFKEKLYGKAYKHKEPYVIPKKSQKKIAEEKKEKEERGDGGLDKFFERNRAKMTGNCQCGCAQKSQKKDDTFYRGSICHIFPKKTFKSIATNDLNWVERAMFGGCHSNMDNRSISIWPMFADWDDIKEKFHQLAPLLTEQERKTKFYSTIEKLIYAI